MKKYMIFCLVIIFANISLFSQNNVDNDVRARILVFIDIYPEVFDVDIYSTEAKALADIFTKAFGNSFFVPDISLNSISDANEKAELQRMIDNFNFLLTEPPTWEQLVNLQKVKSSEPPTPAVYVGDSEAKRFYNSKFANLSRASSGQTGVLIEQETSVEYKEEIVPKK